MEKQQVKTIELSYSKILAYQRCPWLYHLVYQKDWREGPHKKQALGNTLHETLARFYDPNNKNKSLNRLFEILDEAWVNQGFKNVEDVYESYETARKILEECFKMESKRRGHVWGVEKDFRIELDDIVFRGTLDRIDQEDDGSFNLIEYKSNRRGWSTDRIDNDLQMTLYALGMKEGLHLEPVTLNYLFLASLEWVETTRSENQIDKARNLIQETAEQIRRAEFAPNQSYCANCEFNKRCEHSAINK